MFIYRFSKTFKGEIYTIDPNLAVPSSYSKREFLTAKTPRTFFYLNPEDKEAMLGTFLYKAEIPDDWIYDLIADNLLLKAQAKINDTIQFDKLFDLVKQNSFNGVYYRPSQGQIISLFVPVVAKIVSE